MERLDLKYNDRGHAKAGSKGTEELNGKWVPTMKISTGCQVHLRADELPKGKLIVKVSKHSVTVINHVIHDTHNPSRNGTRCVYGYYVI